MMRPLIQNEPKLDRYFVQQVGDAFSTGTEMPGWVVHAAWIVLLAVALLLLMAVWLRKRQATKIMNEPPLGWLTDRQSVVEILENAVINRSKIELSFHQVDVRRRTVPCAFTEYRDGLMVLELPPGISPTVGWIGREVDGFFQIGRSGDSARKRKLFYHFTTSIARIPKVLRSENPRLELATPDKLVLSQKRSFLRMSPPSGLIRFIDIFTETADNLEILLHWACPPTSAAEGEGGLKEYAAALPSLDSSKLFALKDISGGGVRIETKIADKEKNADFAFATAKQYYVALELQADPLPMRYVGLAVARRVFKDPVSGVLDLGLEFSSTLLGPDPQTGLAIWKPLKGEGDPDLETWVVRKYLEIFRQQGVEPSA